MRRTVSVRGMTLIEVLLVVGVVFVVGVALAVAILLPSLGRARSMARQVKDSSQVRGIEHALVVWANQNQGFFPLPSKIDKLDTTVRERGAAKDHTANILSILIYGGHISTDMTISTSESHASAIQPDMNYQFNDPSAAANPVNALWDPAFSADFTGGKIGNTSYAHLLPAGPRKKHWQDNINGTQPIIGNRGPEIVSYTRAKPGRISPVYADAKSYTFLIHGSRSSWEGNVAYNDGHVSFEIRLDPEAVTYPTTDRRKLSDCLFYDEQDDADGTNAFLGIFTKAGEASIDFRAIWD